MFQLLGVLFVVVRGVILQLLGCCFVVVWGVFE